MQQDAAKRGPLVVIFEVPGDMYITVRGSSSDAASNDNTPRHDSHIAHTRAQLLTYR